LHGLGGIRAPRHVRAQRHAVEHHLPIEDGVRVAAQVRPSAREVLAVREVGVRRLIGSDQARPRPELDGHVAQRHPPLHRQALDRRAPVLHRVSGAAPHADAGDDGEDEILGGDVGGEPSGHGHRHLARQVLGQRLRGEHVFHLAGTDAERERPERAVCRRVRVAADDRHAGLGEAELRRDHVDDALIALAVTEQADAELGAVAS
jgi:hypothetical protein